MRRGPFAVSSAKIGTLSTSLSRPLHPLIAATAVDRHLDSIVDFFELSGKHKMEMRVGLQGEAAARDATSAEEACCLLAMLGTGELEVHQRNLAAGMRSSDKPARELEAPATVRRSLSAVLQSSIASSRLQPPSWAVHKGIEGHLMQGIQPAPGGDLLS